MSNQLYYDFFDFLVSDIENVKYFKKNNKNQKEFLDEVLVLIFDRKDLENKIIIEFLDICWTHCYEESRAKKELEEYYYKLNRNFNDSQILDEVFIAYQLLTDVSKGYDSFDCYLFFNM